MKPTVYIRTMSSKELTEKHSDAGVNKVMGHAGGSVGVSFKAKMEFARSNGNLYCLKITDIKAKFYAKPAVYIANNFKRGSCEYNRVLSHERKHVSILKKSHKEFLPEYRDYLRQASRDIPVLTPMTLSDANNKKEDLVNYVNDMLAEYLREMTKEVSLRQKEIDTPEAYRKVQGKCRRWQKKLNEG